MAINTHISDLFFNLDHDANKVDEKGKFVRFDEAKLIEEAEWFCEALDALGVLDVPTPEDVVADFLKRV